MNGFFTEKELSCPCCGENLFHPITLGKLNAVRSHLGFALRGNSGYRCAKYNKRMGYTTSHATGRCMDIGVYGEKADQLLKASYSFGFTGRGIKQKGKKSKRYIHLDDLPPSGRHRPRPWIWSY